jgi:formylglycine-generating enzyme required for sulfatase activity
MTKIFISYRRADSQYVTDSIHDHLIRHFGADNVFLDVGSIPFGVDFRRYLADQIAAHDVVLVIIGPQWAQIMAERAGQEDDFVRIEIENALKQDKLVIPVLVMEARMPSFSALPAGIADLQWRNSATVRRKPDLEGDCNRLAEGIRAYFAGKAPAQPAPPSAPSRPRSLDLLPAPFAWIEIPGGRGTLKTDSANVTLTVPTARYWIAKYPVTNAQFAKFIEAGGYRERQWWTEAGWKAREEGWHHDNGWKPSGQPWTAPSHWADAEWNGAEQPVVGVSWYEAVAFCQWLSETTGERITLPTEAQWQRAAQGDDGRQYPWGNNWDGSRCNNNVKEDAADPLAFLRGKPQTSVKPDGHGVRTTPVDAYQGRGDSPFGVVDMAGNVWEWCTTDYNTGNNDITNKSESRVLRGGSWIFTFADWFRAAYRGSYDPDFRDNFAGFRCARS